MMLAINRFEHVVIEPEIPFFVFEPVLLEGRICATDEHDFLPSFRCIDAVIFAGVIDLVDQRGVSGAQYNEIAVSQVFNGYLIRIFKKFFHRQIIGEYHSDGLGRFFTYGVNQMGIVSGAVRFGIRAEFEWELFIFDRDFGDFSFKSVVFGLIRF